MKPPRLNTPSFSTMCEISTSSMPLPVRRAAEQYLVAGANCALVSIDAETCLVKVAGRGGEALMPASEWEIYKRLCQAAEDPFANVPQGGLCLPLETEDLLHITTGLAVNAKEVLDLINGAARTLSVEDYGDALQGASRRQVEILGCLRQLQVRLAGEVAAKEQERLPATHVLMREAPNGGGDAA